MDERIIFHLDMDYFYAQIEERDDTTLCGKPVTFCMVSERIGSEGAVATSNYLARQVGIKSGMSCEQARNLAPDGAFIPVRKDYYESVSDSIMEAISGSCKTLEQVSIDEAYLDMSGLCSFADASYKIKELKDAILESQSLTCSVGVGPNKIIAKMASSKNKPDGSTIITPEQVTSFISPMPIATLHGIGAKTEKALRVGNYMIAS